MRIRCRVAVGQGKPGMGAVSLGTGKDGLPRLRVSTPANVAGFLYKVRDNVARVHDRFVGEGKLTIQVKLPPDTSIFLSKATPGELTMLLRFLRTESSGKAKENEKESRALPPLTKAKASHIAAPLKSLAIHGPKEYKAKRVKMERVREETGLECLRVVGAVKEVDPAWNRFHKLTRLELEDNPMPLSSLRLLRLSSFPALRTLALPRNSLSHIADECTDGLPTTITVLDLSDNRLTHFPPAFRRLNNLLKLSIDRNKLRGLPPSFGRDHPLLRELSASGNPVEEWPFSLRRCQLHSLDLSGASVDPASIGTPDAPPQPPSLLELAAKSAMDSRFSVPLECLELRVRD